MFLDLIDEPGRWGPVLFGYARSGNNGLQAVAACSWRDSGQPNQPKKLVRVCYTMRDSNVLSAARLLSQ